MVKETPALGIEVTKAFGLELIRQHPEDEMAGKVRRRWPPKDCLPTPAKFIDVEIAQARNLNVKCVSVRRRWTDADARHGPLGYSMPGLASFGDTIIAVGDPIDTTAVHLL